MGGSNDPLVAHSVATYLPQRGIRADVTSRPFGERFDADKTFDMSDPATVTSPDIPEPRERDRPWMMRTYSGHSTAAASNELYRTNLAKGQTGLSIAFDLPTQTGYDSDDPMSKGEVGKVGVPVAHIGDIADAARPDPSGTNEHVNDDQRHCGMVIGALRRQCRGAGHVDCRVARHDAERHREGIPVTRHLHLSAERVPAIDRRHGLHGAPSTHPSGTR